MGNVIIIVISVTFSLIVIIFSIKTIFDTRNKYYKDYLRRKRSGNN